MRFGRTLQISTYRPWRDKYIDYAKLKKLLRDDESAPSSPSTETKGLPWTEKDEGAFVDELVNVQLEKVHAFHKEIYEKLRDRTAKCEAELDSVALTDVKTEEDGADGQTEGSGNGNGNGNGKQPVPSEQEKQKILKDVMTELDSITKETNELEKYARINYTGFLKAAKKHDRKRGASYRLRPLLQVRLAALPFNKEDYSPLLYRLSSMYAFVRQHLEGVSARGPSISEAQEGKEEYTSHKFWVHPENLLEVKTMILRRLPVLVYNPQTSKVAEGSQPDPSITSIYFDNASFSLYTQKVEKSTGGSMRLKWYGQLNNKPEIQVEKKVITDDNMSHESRFGTKEKYVLRLIKDQYHMEKQIKKIEDRAGNESSEAKNFKSSVEEIQEFIKENDLQPVLRANYTRTAFQIPGDDRVRISLDTDLAFIREDAIDSDRPCRDPESWHRSDIDNNELEFPFTSIRKGEIVRFPFALLEIKLRSASKTGEWIQDIMNSHVVKEAPKFSKFVHGVAQLFDDYVNTFPFWLSEMEVDIRRDPQKAFEEEQEKRRKEAEDEVAVGSFRKSKSIAGSGSGQGIVSPVGSHGVSSRHTSPQIEGKVPKSMSQLATSQLGTQLTEGATQQDDIVEEPDEDETGQHAHGIERENEGGFTGGFKSIFPSFSTSKYAQHRRSTNRLPPGVTKPDFWIKDQGEIKVEAKVWLANQRTFVKWQHVAVLLGSLSLGLYNAAGEDNNVARALAVVYILLAVFTGVWGYVVFIWRSNLIERSSGKDFDAVLGPCVVCLGLAVALVANFVFKVSSTLSYADVLR